MRMGATWNTFLGMPLDAWEARIACDAYLGALRRTGRDGEALDAVDGVGLPPDVLYAMPAEALVANVEEGGPLARRMAEAIQAYVRVTSCSVGAHGSSRPEDTVAVTVRVPASAVAEMDEAWETRAECVRVCLAYARNAGLF